MKKNMAKGIALGVCIGSIIGALAGTFFTDSFWGFVIGVGSALISSWIYLSFSGVRQLTEILSTGKEKLFTTALKIWDCLNAKRQIPTVAKLKEKVPRFPRVKKDILLERFKELATPLGRKYLVALSLLTLLSIIIALLYFVFVSQALYYCEMHKGLEAVMSSVFCLMSGIIAFTFGLPTVVKIIREFAKEGLKFVESVQFLPAGKRDTNDLSILKFETRWLVIFMRDKRPALRGLGYLLRISLQNTLVAFGNIVCFSILMIAVAGAHVRIASLVSMTLTAINLGAWWIAKGVLNINLLTSPLFFISTGLLAATGFFLGRVIEKRHLSVYFEDEILDFISNIFQFLPRVNFYLHEGDAVIRFFDYEPK